MKVGVRRGQLDYCNLAADLAERLAHDCLYITDMHRHEYGVSISRGPAVR